MRRASEQAVPRQRPLSVIVSCEHATAALPPPYRHLLRGAKLPPRHRGHDAGAWPLAQQLARALDAPLFRGTHNRLLIDLNRAPRNPGRFSRFTRKLPADERRTIHERYYAPYRDAVTRAIEETIAAGYLAVHLSIHSFSRVLRGQVRTMDIGLLYDPRRAGERRFSQAWRKALKAEDPSLEIRYNAPYRGRADGFPYHLRKTLPERHYWGIELEVNQHHLTARDRFPVQLSRAIVTSAAHALVACEPAAPHRLQDST
jgi:predicted N-formylglutamate amidohydrolase